MQDFNFRQSLPESLSEDVQKYEQNPSCPCNLPIYRKVLKHAVKQLREYYPGQPIVDPDVELAQLAKNNFSVINCGIAELEDLLRKLPPGRKQIAVARYQDQATVVVNELDII